jgi:hypothetical protein
LVPRRHRKQSIGPGHGAGRVLQEAELLVQRGIAREQRAADHVAVTIQVLGHRMEHHVGAQFERPLEPRRHERVVHHHRDATRLGDRHHGGDVGELHERVGGRLDEHHARLRRERRGDPPRPRSRPRR